VVEHSVNGVGLQPSRQIEDGGDIGTEARQTLGEAGDLGALGGGERPGLPATKLLLVEPKVALLLA
jgi:hypothetical protein